MVNKLIHVLLRFREHKYAFQADIEAMYNQVRLPIHDRDALRFLWLENDKLVCYRHSSCLVGFGVARSQHMPYAARLLIARM